MELPLNNWGDLKKRTFSSIILAVIAVLCAWVGSVIFTSLIIVAALLMFKEWEKLVPALGRNFELAGYLYVVFPCACIIWLRQVGGFSVFLALVAVISATDIGAYFAGRKFGKHTILPSISPNKTWEGLAGGALAATVTGILFASSINHHFLTFAVLVSPLMAVVAQAGDFFQSWVKRKAGVKDSGDILPGHGGLLDRFDGYMFATPLLVVLVCIFM